MLQIIRHANQAQAAVESLIMVRVPHKGTSPSDPPRSSPTLHMHPHSPSAPDRQMEQAAAQPVGQRRVRGGQGARSGGSAGGGVAICGFGLGGTVYFWIMLKCLSESQCCFSCTLNK